MGSSLGEGVPGGGGVGRGVAPTDMRQQCSLPTASVSPTEKPRGCSPQGSVSERRLTPPADGEREPGPPASDSAAPVSGRRSMRPAAPAGDPGVTCEHGRGARPCCSRAGASRSVRTALPHLLQVSPQSGRRGVVWSARTRGQGTGGGGGGTTVTGRGAEREWAQKTGAWSRTAVQVGGQRREARPGPCRRRPPPTGCFTASPAEGKGWKRLPT